MRRFLTWVGAALCLGFVGCAPTAQQKADYAEAQRQGVEAQTYQKLVQGQPLTLHEIKELAQKKVSPGVVVRHLRWTQTVYRLTTVQVDDLRKSGVADMIVDELLASPQYVEDELRRRELLRPYSYYDDPYYYDPYYHRRNHHHHYHPIP